MFGGILAEDMMAYDISHKAKDECRVVSLRVKGNAQRHRK
jgi:hypothetical protein